MASHGGWLYHPECNDAGHAHLLDALICNLQHRLFLLPAQPAYFCVPALACVFQLSAVSDFAMLFSVSNAVRVHHGAKQGRPINDGLLDADWLCP
ncbi:hypothetical protein [Burkholderia pseudomallei]|uniref:hypothetical protein n=1 Tax=Burkholderia pseudomallei TaxID=28450 RepID=UPI000538BE3F|nr:hypothetical protein [Burkholderia pseudomallei]KGW01305.1 hypothetical protein X882_1503 [Burkholderia pseudomallei MSHR4303]KGX14081.1 hypothetical protein X896_5269 [Burkholderia pseudomallei ABCPW 1]KKB67716.1 hypothetical protein BBMA_1274 [Burkholderia pseudomallei MSHR1079]ONB85207.1 hypothetical protein AQ906_18635 [Burkholderia pseudomallei]ONC75219.1 hypothetical protein AQ920_28440 [Burkholderia pseudomallei]